MIQKIIVKNEDIRKTLLEIGKHHPLKTFQPLNNKQITKSTLWKILELFCKSHTSHFIFILQPLFCISTRILTEHSQNSINTKHNKSATKHNKDTKVSSWALFAGLFELRDATNCIQNILREIHFSFNGTFERNLHWNSFVKKCV